MSGSLEILYVGGRHRNEVVDLRQHGTRIRTVANLYEGIAHLKRHHVGAALVEFGVLEPGIGRAVRALRAAAGDRPLLVMVTADEWERIRAEGSLHHEEILLRPFFPDELWRRVNRVALPPPAKAVASFRDDADRLSALMLDLQQLNRFTNDLKALTNHCARIVKTRLRAGRVSIFIKERHDEGLRPWEAEQLEGKLRQTAVLRIGEGVAGKAAQSQRIVLVKEAGRDGPASAEREYRHSSYMIVPLVHLRDVLGVICVTDRLEPGPFTESDVAYMEAFAESLSLTIHNGMQYRAADELATIDEGTQLFNRRYFNRVLPQEVVRAKRYEHDLTLALIDIDFFKQYNDSNGHQAGDHALAAVARILKESFREADIVVRYGGEEFAVIMPGTTQEDGNGVGIVERARKQIEAANLMFVDSMGNRRPLTVSGGVATFPHQAQTSDDLFDLADKALYRAKARGRNLILGA